MIQLALAAVYVWEVFHFARLRVGLDCLSVCKTFSNEISYFSVALSNLRLGVLKIENNCHSNILLGTLEIFQFLHLFTLKKKP